MFGKGFWLWVVEDTGDQVCFESDRMQRTFIKFSQFWLTHCQGVILQQ